MKKEDKPTTFSRTAEPTAPAGFRLRQSIINAIKKEMTETGETATTIVNRRLALSYGIRRERKK